MTYFGFLAFFLLPPIVLLALLTWRDRRAGRRLDASWHSWPAGLVLLAHIVVAVVYTTPWDNYLVATSVWWYDPDLVTGLTLGWVPIEEYTFFVLQSLFTGLWVLYLARRWPGAVGHEPRLGLRRGLLFGGGLLWVVMVAILAVGWQPGNYLALILVWALPPILIQVGFGADILLQRARLVLAGIAGPTLYLAVADSMAIYAGTWTISPDKTLGWYLGGVLPLEEFLFFLVTNVLLVFGMVLVLAVPSHVRLAAFRERRQGGPTAGPPSMNLLGQ